MGFLITSLSLFIIWLGLMLFSPSTRREQAVMSIVGAIITPGVLLIAIQDYRNIIATTTASIGIEDFIFVFSLFGISAVIYQIIAGKHLHKLKGERIVIPDPSAHLLTHLILVLGLWAVISLVLVHVFAMAAMQALIVAGLFIGTYIIADRHDLLLNALISGLLMAGLIFLIEQLFFVRLFSSGGSSLWQMTNSVFLIGGVPLEEILWAGVVGFTVGPLYEWLRRYELR
jgi:hypothetical protein